MNEQGIKSGARPDPHRAGPERHRRRQRRRPIFSIRGIVANVGAATTGIYLDDTALAKRANTGIQQNNGAPARCCSTSSGSRC